MPLYEYVCTACGAETEKLQRLSDAPLSDCPACHASALQRKISAAGFRLKGGGWYETDFKAGGRKNIAGDTAGGKSDGVSAETGCGKPACGTGACAA